MNLQRRFKHIRFSLIEFNANTVIIYELFELSPNRMPIGNHVAKCRIFSTYYSFVYSMLFAIIPFIHTNKMTHSAHTHNVFIHSDLKSIDFCLHRKYRVCSLLLFCLFSLHLCLGVYMSRFQKLNPCFMGLFKS